MTRSPPLFALRDLSAASRAAIATALFWLLTYAVLTGRASMIYGDTFSLTNERRLVALTAGAGIFWLVIRTMVIGARPGAARPALVIATVIPATLTVLAARWFMDWAVFEADRPLDQHVRWVLVWAGYYGLAVCGLLAFEMHAGRGRRVARTGWIAPASRPRAAVAETTRPTDVIAEPLDWLVDAITTEMAARPAADRIALARRLVSRAGYELADDGDPDAPAHNARVRLANRVAARLTRR